MKQNQRVILSATCASHALIHVFELSVPGLLILIQREFAVGDLQMGQIVTLYGMLFGLGSLPAGFLVDRLGSRPLVLVCLWGASVSLLGMALAGSLATFTLSAACMGLCLSIYHPAGTALITHALEPSGRVFALHGMAGNSGVAGATLIAGGLGAALGWRWALGVLAIAGFLLGAWITRLPAPAVHEIRARPGHGRWQRFALLLVAAGFMGVVYRGMTTFLPKFFALRYHADPESGAALGGALTTLALIAGLFGMYISGRLADRGYGAAWIFLAAAVLQMPFLVAIGLFAGPVLVPLAMGVSFFHFMTQPVGNQLVAEFTPPVARGLGYGIYFFMTFGAGSVGATLAGWVSERVELGWAFPVLALALIPSVLAIGLLGLVTRRGARESG